MGGMKKLVPAAVVVLGFTMGVSLFLMYRTHEQWKPRQHRRNLDWDDDGFWDGGRVVGGGEVQYGEKAGVEDALDKEEGAARAQLHAKHTCDKRAVFVKTHGTGGSVVTNVLHRVAFHNDLTVALPRQGASLGWPSERALISSLESSPPFDMLCTGSARYSPALMNKVVPDANAYITLLQHPSTQFLAVWDYLDLVDRITDEGLGERCSNVHDFVDNFYECETVLSEAERVLLHNSMSYDLGLSPRHPEKAIQLIDHLTAHFDVVLIREHLDESLLVMKHILCLDTEDIMYYEPTYEEPDHHKVADGLKLSIKRLSSADHALYMHFNKTLWESVGNIPNFAMELAQFRVQLQDFAGRCAAYSHSSAEEHREYLTIHKESKTDWEYCCRLALLGAVDFLPLLRRRQRLPADPQRLPPSPPTPSPSPSPPPSPPAAVGNSVDLSNWDNCPAGSRKDKIVWIKTHKTGSSTMTNVFHRYAHKHKLKTVIPKGDLFLGWPHGPGVMTSFIDPLPGMKKGDPFEMFCSAHHRYYRRGLEKLVPDAAYITLLRHPVSHFISSWKYWGVGRKVGERGGGDCVEWDYYIMHRAECQKFLTNFDQILTHNSMSFDLGLEMAASQTEIEGLVDELQNKFAMTLITEYMDESLVLMKRRLCWELEDVVYFSFKVNKKKAKAVVSEEHQNAIKEYSHNDWVLYQALNKTLWDGIAKEKDFFEEVEALRKLRVKDSEACANWSRVNEDHHVRALIEQEDTLPSLERECHIALLDSKGFSRFLKYESGIPPGLWCSRTPQNLFMYLWPHGASDTLSNVIVRLGLDLGVRMSIPLNDETFDVGWPTLDNAQTQFISTANTVGQTSNLNPISHSRFFKGKMSKVSMQGKSVTVMSEPVETFMRNWDKLGLAALMGDDNNCNTIVNFAKNWKQCTAKLTKDMVVRVVNPMTYDYGLEHDAPMDIVKPYGGMVGKEMSVVLIDERMSESLVLLKRIFCFRELDIVHIPLENPPPSAAVLQALSELPEGKRRDFNKSVRAMSGNDAHFYRYYNDVLNKRLGREVGVPYELSQLEKHTNEFKQRCSQYYSDTEEEHLTALTKNGVNKEETSCRLPFLRPRSLRTYLIHRFKLNRATL